MTAHEHMTKHLRKVSGGGLAWEWGVFTGDRALGPLALVDAAVDIAWARLMPKTLERPSLEVRKEGSSIVFRIRMYSLDDVLAQTNRGHHDECRGL